MTSTNYGTPYPEVALSRIEAILLKNGGGSGGSGSADWSTANDLTDLEIDDIMSSISTNNGSSGNSDFNNDDINDIMDAISTNND